MSGIWASFRWEATLCSGKPCLRQDINARIVYDQEMIQCCSIDAFMFINYQLYKKSMLTIYQYISGSCRLPAKSGGSALTSRHEFLRIPRILIPWDLSHPCINLMHSNRSHGGLCVQTNPVRCKHLAIAMEQSSRLQSEGLLSHVDQLSQMSVETV